MNRPRSRFDLPALLAGLGACLLAAALTALLLTAWQARRQMDWLDGFCTALVQRDPASAGAVYSLAKDGSFAPGRGVLAARGYRAALLTPDPGPAAAAALAGLAAGGALWAAWCLARRRTARQTGQLIAVLEAARAARPLPVAPQRESPFAPLADEIGKTVTELARTREQALAARDRFARSLADIAHQIKTPLTALSLAAQAAGAKTRRALDPQIERLTGLAESLLTLARLDSGALPLHPEPADLYTLLMLAADNLQPLAQARRVALDVPETPPAAVRADPDWTVEALMNLLKNAVEHTPPGGAVRCRIEENPLYTQLTIRDGGTGFAAADLPRLFERFYRGAQAAPGSTGIGLPIAKELLERQNAVLTAGNDPAGGGRFTVRFYRA